MHKSTAFLFLALCFSMSYGYTQTAAVFGHFVGSSPCGNVIRPLLQMSEKEECDFTKWQITLYQDPVSKTPTVFKLKALYGLSQPNTSGFIGGGISREAEGKWSIVKGTKTNPEAVVYQLNPDRPALFLSFVKMDDNVIHLLYTDKSLMIGNAGYSYTFNKANNLP